MFEIRTRGFIIRKEKAMILALYFIDRCIWFSMTPLPADYIEVNVKEEEELSYLEEDFNSIIKESKKILISQKTKS